MTLALNFHSFSYLSRLAGTMEDIACIMRGIINKISDSGGRYRYQCSFQRFKGRIHGIGCARWWRFNTRISYRAVGGLMGCQRPGECRIEYWTDSWLYWSAQVSKYAAMDHFNWPLCNVIGLHFLFKDFSIATFGCHGMTITMRMWIGVKNI